jgi:beta-glucanase (GH16 family)
MYIVVNLAVGGWAEAPDPDTQFPATLQVDWIRAYVPPASREGIRSDGTKTPTH